MRTVLFLAVVFVVVCGSDAGWLRRFWSRNKDRILNAVVAYNRGNRDIRELDINQDGVVDHEELNSMLTERDASELLEFADNNGDNEISIEEFERALENMGHR